jgi:hypothetical protein
MTWQPGQPVMTERDRREWEQWRRDSKREAQRSRRARYPRIDYYPALDVRKINRAWQLMPGSWFSWQRTCNGEKTAWIQIRADTDRMLLDYRNCSPHHNGGEWEHMSYPVRLDWTPWMRTSKSPLPA